MNKSCKLGTALLVTSQVTQRAGLRKALTDLGIDNKLIEVAGDFNQAKERLTKSPVSILIADEEISGRPGMELFELFKQNNPVSKERIFLVMTQETSPFFFADFSLKGGDVILSKPFTNETFSNVLGKAIAEKEKLEHDEVLSLDIQDAIRLNNLNKSRELLAQFKNLQSIHAFYSTGLICEAEGEMDLAYENYMNCLQIKEDFKSLVGLIRIGTAQQKYEELIDYVELWLKHFPLHHNLILDISRIIVANKKFALLDEVFLKHKINDVNAKIPLAAAFVMAASYHMDIGEKEIGKEYIRKAFQFSSKKVGVLYKILEVLMKANEAKEAEQIYMKMELPLSTPEEKVIDIKMKYIIFPKQTILMECLKLLAQKIVDQDLYRIAISCMKSIGKDPDDIIVQAKEPFLIKALILLTNN